MKQCDIAIIGGGPGGYVAAIRAAQLGLKVIVVEKEHMGGICLNWGCIPTKALLKSSEVHYLLTHADQYGFEVGKVTIDFEKVIARSRQVATQLSKGIEHLMKKNNVEVVRGSAQLKSSKEIIVDQKDVIGAKNIIIATGARARVLPGFEPDGKLILTYKEALSLTTLPKKLLVLGSGAIGVEFASFYSNMGAEVTVLEIADRILPVEDEEVSAFMQKSLEKQGMKIHIKSQIKSLKKLKNSIEVEIDNNGKKEAHIFDALIVAVGIVGNVENLGLEKTKIRVEKTHIITNEWSETDEKGVYAIGDVAAGPWLAHKASHEGIIAIEKIAGVKGVHPMKRNLIPGCTYSMPQVASVGLTEKQALEKGHKIKVGRFPFMANGKAIAIGKTEGFVKTIFDEKTGELLGAHLVQK